MNNIQYRVPIIVILMTAGLAASLGLLIDRRQALGNNETQLGQADPADLSDGSAPQNGALSLRLELFSAGLAAPVGVANSGDLRLFVLEQAGRIRIVRPDGQVEATPFLDIRDRVDASSFEEGLLGLAFDPMYRVNGRFYVNYTHTTSGERRTRISRFTVTANPDVADASSEEILLTVDQPYANHNAGGIAFGPDSLLYIPLGDGGDRDDPHDYAQNHLLLLGKISRIDVRGHPGSPADCPGLGTGNYTIPASNPFVDGPGNQCDEIWASGLRNPWQSTFDSKTGDLFVADVGQDKVEEVNFQPSTSTGGENYGWRCYEGSSAYITDGCSAAGSYTFPIFEYTRPSPFGDCSVTGGYVYRGRLFHAMVGRYFLTDYCSGRFWDLQKQPNDTWRSTAHNDVFPPGDATTVGNSAFGQRCDGELYVANVINGKIYHLTDTTSADRSATGHAGQIIEPDHWIYLPLLSLPACR